MKPPFPRVILATNLVVAAGALVWVLWEKGGAALAVLALDPSWSLFGAFLATMVGLWIVATWRWRLLVAHLGPAPAPASLMWYRLAGQSVSMLIPSAKLGGEPVRGYLLARDGVAGADAIASVAVDRVLDMGAGTVFTVLFAAVLLQYGMPSLEGTLEGVFAVAVGLLAGIGVTMRRLHGGRGVVTSMVRRTRLDRWGVVERRMTVVDDAEQRAHALVARLPLMAAVFVLGLLINAGVLLEYVLLLETFGLPAQPIAVVAAIFATGAAHSMPVPAGIGVLEGAQMALFAALGYPADVGLAVALAVRLRELLWLLPGFVYLLGRGIAGMALRESVA
ncbi:MAG TPA: lysylphosphatidylglycerol synthase transmembrane domain-containing protein [Candidatus Limnocylindria bacterium]|nr:lysylphosphatidylglycerol synthase transmembrane domain-containing protein [Candidatus Limnocylindria bacterium]